MYPEEIRCKLLMQNIDVTSKPYVGAHKPYKVGRGVYVQCAISVNFKHQRRTASLMHVSQC